MTILRSGSTKKYSDNWGSAFGGKTAKKATAKKKSAKAKPKSKKKKKK